MKQWKTAQLKPSAMTETNSLDIYRRPVMAQITKFPENYPKGFSGFLFKRLRRGSHVLV